MTVNRCALSSNGTDVAAIIGLLNFDLIYDTVSQSLIKQSE
ncbi:MAG: hypothetical protein PHD07_05345 [Bacteroidales bacterium]|jgi:hypothetical protein|nr:hypothetical protein [Bacteroidales bacterium]MDD3200754.1 hypothetical protein [Bacteroidales bacterium]